MKKLSFVFLFALAFASANLYAGTQIDRGESKDSGKTIFFVGRYARTTAIGTNGNMISKDRLVVWDSTSNDGVTVNYTTTSFDPLVAGISIDDIPGSSSDNTAASDLSSSTNNWGRIRTYGRHASVSFDTHAPKGAGAEGLSAGLRVSASGVAGRATVFLQTSGDRLEAASRDSFGVLLEAPASTDGVSDIQVRLT